MRSPLALGLVLALAIVACKDKPPVPAAGDAAAQPVAKPKVPLPGVDTSALSPSEANDYYALVGELPAPCAEVKATIAECVLEKKACKKCVSAAKYVARGVRVPLSRSQLEAGLKRRFDPAETVPIPIDDSPTKGPASAAVTVVVFADYQATNAPKVIGAADKSFESHKDSVRYVLKFRPKDTFRGLESAKAVVAAGMQGKLWEMHAKFASGPLTFETAKDLEPIAKELKLDAKRFATDMAGDKVSDRLARDKAAATGARIVVGPAVFVNGREFDPAEDLDDWIERELP